MSYQEDVALVLEAMGQWLEPSPGAPGTQVGLIDANFIVEQVIPWALTQGLSRIDVGYQGQWYASCDPDRFNGSERDKGWQCTGNTMPEAVMAALAAALRAGQ